VRQMVGDFAHRDALAIFIWLLSLMTRLGDTHEGLIKGEEDWNLTAASNRLVGESDRWLVWRRVLTPGYGLGLISC
jgi:hypothetical protein